MKNLCLGFAAGLALILTLDAAQAATAGHLFKSATPTAGSDQAITGAITTPGAASAETKRASRKPMPQGIAKPNTAPAH